MYVGSLAFSFPTSCKFFTGFSIVVHLNIHLLIFIVTDGADLMKLMQLTGTILTLERSGQIVKMVELPSIDASSR